MIYSFLDKFYVKASFRSKCLTSFTVATWIGLAIFMAMFAYYHKDSGVTGTYWKASLNWIKGLQMYDMNSNCGAFGSFPQGAILHIPLAVLPNTLAKILWRIFNVSIMAYFCYLFTRLYRNVPKGYVFFLVSLITIPLAYDSLRNGQLNILITVFTIAIFYLMCEKKYKAAIIVCYIGLAFKPYMLIPLLVITGIYPRKTMLTTVLGGISFVLFPFLFQTPDYVVGQYKSCLELFRIQNQRGLEIGYTDFWGILRSMNLKINYAKVNVIFSAFSGLTVYAYCIYLKKKQNQYVRKCNSMPASDNNMHAINYNLKTIQMIYVLIIALPTAYSLLFGTRIEFCTYVLAAPFIAYFIILALQHKKWAYAILTITCWFIMFSARVSCKAITPELHNYCIWPIFLGFLIFIIITLSYFVPIILISSDKSKNF
jgi:hypothetical protein